MGVIISKTMKIGEIKQILNDNGIETPRGWQMVLIGLFNLHNTDTAEIIGSGRNAEFVFKKSQ